MLKLQTGRKKLIILSLAVTLIFGFLTFTSNNLEITDNLNSPLSSSLLTTTAISSPPPLSSTPKPTFASPRQLISARVTRVVDGDTIEVELATGVKRRVRYIGIDAPEPVGLRQSVTCYGKEAAEKNSELVNNKVVELEKDVSEIDRYRRLLRYVYVDETMVNYQLVAGGFATAVSYPPDIKYQKLLREGERIAKTARSGIWSACNQK